MPAVPAAAATVDAGVNVILNGEIVSERDSIVANTLAEGRSTAEASAGTGTARALAQGDAGRGTLHASLADIDGDAKIRRSPPTSPPTAADRCAFVFDTSASWTGSAVNAAFFETNLVAGDGFVSDYFDGDPGPAFQPSGNVAHRLSYTATVVDGGSYRLVATAFASLFVVDGPSSATIDGLLSYRPAAGMSLAFDDPGFLAAPVPLPPSALLLAGGLFGLALLGRRAERGRRAAAAA